MKRSLIFSTLILLLTTIIFFSCKSNGGKGSGVKLPEVSDTVKDLRQLPRVLAAYGKPDSSTGVDFLWVKQINDTFRNEETKEVEYVRRTEVWGLPKYITDTAVDAKTLKPIYDTANKKWVMLTLPAFDRQISADSVRWKNLEGIPMDSILTRGFWKIKN